MMKNVAITIWITSVIFGIWLGREIQAQDTSFTMLYVTMFNWKLMLSTWFVGFVNGSLFYGLNQILEEIKKINKIQIKKQG